MHVPALNVETNYPTVLSISESSYKAVLKALKASDSIDTEENRERNYIQEQVDAKFTTEEQSIIWRCMNDKNIPSIHEKLNPIVRKNLSTTVPVELYRGISLIEANKIYDLEEGETFTLNRVTSFSSDFSTAKQFASKWHYDSQIVLSIRNCPMAYNYYEDIVSIILGAPNCEFNKNVLDESRLDKLDMVEAEKEFMLPSEAEYRIVYIEDYQKDPNEVACTIYHLELIGW